MRDGNPSTFGNGGLPGQWWPAQRWDLTVRRFFGYVLAVGLAAAIALILRRGMTHPNSEDRRRALTMTGPTCAVRRSPVGGC